MVAKKIDNQHKKLFKIIDSLNDKYFLNRNEFNEILNILWKYTKEHFKEEERFMEEIKYTYCLPHKGCHMVFKESICKLRERTKNDTSELIDSETLLQLSTFLNKWLEEHILNDDMLIKNFIELNNKKA